MSVPKVPMGADLSGLSSILVTVNQATSGLDLTTVTAVSFDVQRPDGTIVSWAGLIYGTPTTSQLQAQHVLVPGDLPMDGPYELVAQLTVPAGTVQCYAAPIQVTTKYAGT